MLLVAFGWATYYLHRSIITDGRDEPGRPVRLLSLIRDPSLPVDDLRPNNKEESERFSSGRLQEAGME